LLKRRPLKNSRAKIIEKVPKPIPATNIEIVKKVFAEDMEKGKGKPSPSPKTGGAATGKLGATLTEGANKYAVVIGICDYPGEDNDICTSDGDSLHMYKALTDLYGFEPENIKLFKDGGGTTGSDVAYGIPTHDNIYNAIMDIRGNATSSDEVVFFSADTEQKGRLMGVMLRTQMRQSLFGTPKPIQRVM